MAAKALARGMGTYYKDCEHPASRWARCPHFYKVRYRGPGGNQVEESDFLDKDAAIDRLTSVYKAKKAAPTKQAKSERIEKYGQMRFREYTTEWKARQRHLAAASLSHLDSLLQHHIFPALASRRMSTFDHKVVDRFIRTMERNGVGLAAQSNAYDKLKSILLDAHRLGLFDDNPLLGDKPPQYDPTRAVIPSPAPAPGPARSRGRHLPTRSGPHEWLRPTKRGGSCGQRQQHRGRRRLPSHRAGQPDDQDVRPPQAPQARRVSRRPPSAADQERHRVVRRQARRHRRLPIAAPAGLPSALPAIPPAEPMAAPQEAGRTRHTRGHGDL